MHRTKMSLNAMKADLKQGCHTNRTVRDDTKPDTKSVFSIIIIMIGKGLRLTIDIVVMIGIMILCSLIGIMDSKDA